MGTHIAKSGSGPSASFWDKPHYITGVIHIINHAGQATKRDFNSSSETDTQQASFLTSEITGLLMTKRQSSISQQVTENVRSTEESSSTEKKPDIEAVNNR